MKKEKIIVSYVLRGEIELDPNDLLEGEEPEDKANNVVWDYISLLPSNFKNHYVGTGDTVERECV